MKIIHTADWHLGKNLEGQSRLEEQEAFLEDFLQIVEEKNADLILIAGDIYDSSNPPAKAEQLFYNTLKKLSGGGQRLTFVISGNHDNPERLVAAGPIAAEHGIIMAGLPKTEIQPGSYGQHYITEAGKCFVKVEVNGETAVILFLPFPSEKRLNEVLYHDLEDEKQLASYEERISHLLKELELHYQEQTINLLISHLFVMGSEEGGSERSIQLGGSFLLNSSIFPKKAQYIALGHVHKPQVVPGSGKRARYSGSPIHYHKSEINLQKKILFVEVTEGQEAMVEDILLPIYKPIEVWKCSSIEEAIQRCEENTDKNCWVYLEIITDRYIREDEIKEMKQWKSDILEIRPILKDEENIAAVKSYRERPFEEVFREFYRNERGTEVEEETLKLLLSIVEGDL